MSLSFGRRKAIRRDSEFRIVRVRLRLAGGPVTVNPARA